MFTIEDEKTKKRYMADIAFSGVFYGLADSSWVIFDHLERQVKNTQPCIIGKAFCNIVAERYKEAREILEEQVLKEDPACIEAKVFLALILKLTKRNAQAEKICAELRGNDQAVIKGLGEQISKMVH